jgi:hypothetical protein
VLLSQPHSQGLQFGHALYSPTQRIRFAEAEKRSALSVRQLPLGPGL